MIGKTTDPQSSNTRPAQLTKSKRVATNDSVCNRPCWLSCATSLSVRRLL